MAYPTHDERNRPSELPRGTFGYEPPREINEVPSGRSLLVLLGAVVVIIALVALFSWTGTGTDQNTTGSITPPATMEQTERPVDVTPAPMQPQQ